MQPEVQAGHGGEHVEQLGMQPVDIGVDGRDQEEAGGEERGQPIRVVSPQVVGRHPDHGDQQQRVEHHQAVGAPERGQRRRQQREDVGLAEVHRPPAVVGRQDQVVDRQVRELGVAPRQVFGLAAQVAVLDQRQRR